MLGSTEAIAHRIGAFRAGVDAGNEVITHVSQPEPSTQPKIMNRPLSLVPRIAPIAIALWA